MNWSRREMLRLAGTASLALPLSESACGGRPQARLLPSGVPLPSAFESKLPVPPTLNPDRKDASTDYYDVRVRPATAHILPGLATTIWGYGGIFPGPTIEARRGRKTLLRLWNTLPVPIVNHLHGGRTPPESDGYPTDLLLPSGFDAPDLHDPRARTIPEQREYVYPNEQRAATLWYHDHRMDFTAPQVWRGLAGFYILRDEEETQLPLPRGDKEIPLLICDRSFDVNGSFLYPAVDSSLRGQPGV
ncbi:MAG TPA: multicopper oxidase domain-containing protein, partial [Bryobacteraceae bacterium]